MNEKIENAIENGPGQLNSESISRTGEESSHRKPTHPGVYLRQFLEEKDITQDEVAQLLEVSRQTINKICNEHWGISTRLALKLSAVFSPGPAFWIGLSKNWELFEEKRKMRGELQEIRERYQNQKPVAY